MAATLPSQGENVGSNLRDTLLGEIITNPNINRKMDMHNIKNIYIELLTTLNTKIYKINFHISIPNILYYLVKVHLGGMKKCYLVDEM